MSATEVGFAMEWVSLMFALSISAAAGYVVRGWVDKGSDEDAP